MAEKRTEFVGLRLNTTELATLKALAEREERSPASWVRSRMKAEAERIGLTATAQAPATAQR